MSLTDEDKSWLSAQIQAVGTGLRADIEATETRLLRAFHDSASPAEMRARTHNAVLRAMDIEIEPLPNRISKPEPPQ